MQIRTAHVEDVPALVELMQQLGYAINHRDLQANLGYLTQSARDEILVADVGERLLGCICLHCMTVLQSPVPLGRITALVVADNCRGEGVGQALVERAEDYFRQQGCDVVEVTSSAHRHGAHQFYLARGYRESSSRFSRRLSSDA